jgi:hypothetical protein
MRAGISESTRPAAAKELDRPQIINNRPLAVSLPRPDEFLRLTIAHALVELQIRRTMAARGLNKIPLYPESRACASPSAVRIFEVFDGLTRQHLIDTDGGVVQTFAPELTKLQAVLLDLLGVPEDRYQ